MHGHGGEDHRIKEKSGDGDGKEVHDDLCCRQLVMTKLIFLKL